MAERRFTLAQKFMASTIGAVYDSRRIPVPPSNNPVSIPRSDAGRILPVGNGLLAETGVDGHDQAECDAIQVLPEDDWRQEASL